MDVQHQITHTMLYFVLFMQHVVEYVQTYYKHLFSAGPRVEEGDAGTIRSSRHEGRRVHLCTRCGWPFSNPHPSAKHRRSHKKHCGTIEGYTVLIGAEAVSDEDHHADTDKENSPSEMVLLSVGTNEELNALIVVSKVDASLEVTEMPVTDAEKTREAEIKTLHDFSESKLELTETDEKCVGGLFKDGAVDLTPEPVHVSESQEAETIEVTKTTPDVSITVGQDADNIKQEDCEKIESEAVKEYEVNNDKIKLDHEVASEKVTVEEIKIEKIESDGELAPEEVSESDKKVSASIAKEDIGEHIQESNVVTEFSDSRTSQGGLVKMSFDEDLFYSIYVNNTETTKPTTSAKRPDYAAKKDEFLSDEISDSGTSQGASVKMSFDEDSFYSIYVNVTEAKKPTTLKDLLAIAKSQSTKETDHAAKKDEAVNDKKGNPMSPPKLIEDGKKGRKKVKGVRSWLPFVSCFSINVVDEKVMPIQ